VGFGVGLGAELLWDVGLGFGAGCDVLVRVGAGACDVERGTADEDGLGRTDVVEAAEVELEADEVGAADDVAGVVEVLVRGAGVRTR
jgi:hypothetical protein